MLRLSQRLSIWSRTLVSSSRAAPTSPKVAISSLLPAPRLLLSTAIARARKTPPPAALPTPFQQHACRSVLLPASRLWLRGAASYSTSLVDTSERATLLDERLWEFFQSDLCTEAFAARYGSRAILPEFVRFSRHLSSIVPPEIRELLLRSSTTVLESNELLLPLFLEYAATHEAVPTPTQPKRREWRLEDLQNKELSDLRFPESWYPEARALKRKITLHVGPTNSGKTHTALQRLASASSGVYCGPLRLLAHEVYERMNALGCPTSLITGQQQLMEADARHISCTIEMLDTANAVDVAIIDEVQMLADDERGWAWTRALLGVPAREVHLCGNESANALIERLCQTTGDELSIIRYERLSPLRCQSTVVSSLRDLTKGDCVVAFSRRKIYDLKQAIERNTKHKCCIIYGSLPPEIRSQQASIFNQGDERTILVASNAIGMGLNLNIRRVVFSDISKYDGYAQRHLSESEVKQIAGRAGRFNGAYPKGLVSCFQPSHLDFVQNALLAPLEETPSAGLRPQFEQLELFTRHVHATYGSHVKFSGVLRLFARFATVSSNYFLCRFEDVLEAAEVVDDVELELRERYLFCCAPSSKNDTSSLYYLRQYALAYAASMRSFRKSGERLEVGTGQKNLLQRLQSQKHYTKEILSDLESVHHILELYLWLSLRFPLVFTKAATAERERAVCHRLIEAALLELAQPVMDDVARHSKSKHQHKRKEKSKSESNATSRSKHSTTRRDYV